MRLIKNKYPFFLSCVLACLFFLCSDSFGAEEITEGRKLYDNIMLCVNFGILAFIIVKFARKPLLEFLRGVREKIAEEHGEIDNQLGSAKSKMEAEKAKVEQIDRHIAKIRENIIEMGKKEKEKIIKQAIITAEKMIEDAKAYAGYQMAKAKKELSDEMVDIAISMVETRLEEEISRKDNEKLVDQFLVNLETIKPQLN